MNTRPRFGSREDEFACASYEVATITLPMANRARGGLGMTGPFQWPLGGSWTDLYAYSQALRALEDRVREIAPQALAPDPSFYGQPVIALPPWIYVEWALRGKFSAIIGRDVMELEDIRDREGPWRTIFG